MISTNDFQSDFQLEQSFVSDCHIENCLITLGSDTTLENTIEVSVSDILTNNNNDRKTGYVRLKAQGSLSVKENSRGTCVYGITMQGEFSAPMQMDDANMTNMLWFNGSSILYGVLRAKMEVITSMVFETGKITLPTINMIELIKHQSEMNKPSSDKN